MNFLWVSEGVGVVEKVGGGKLEREIFTKMHQTRVDWIRDFGVGVPKNWCMV